MKPLIDLDEDGKRSLQVVREWPDRTQRARAQIASLLVQEFRKELVARIPEGKQWDAYRHAIEVVGLGQTMDALAVRVSASRAGARKIDPTTNIIYVRSKRKMRKPNPAIAILEKHSPWTTNTLPFMPSKAEAQVVVRRVTKNELSRIDRDRRRDRRQWSVELARVRVKANAPAVTTSRTAEAIPDVAFEGYRLEFGIGQKRKRHWQPALQALLNGSLLEKVMKRDQTLERTFTDSRYHAWNSWPKPRTHVTISDKEAAKFIPFMRRLLAG